MLKINIKINMTVTEKPECGICYEDITKDTGKVVTKCGHIYCPSCFAKHMRNDNTCAVCRDVITDDKPFKENSPEPEPYSSFSYTMSSFYPSVFSYLPVVTSPILPFGLNADIASTMASDFDITVENNNARFDEQAEQIDHEGRSFVNFMNNLLTMNTV